MVATIATLSEDSSDWTNTKKIPNEANETFVENSDALPPEDLGKEISADTNTDKRAKTERKLDTGKVNVYYHFSISRILFIRSPLDLSFTLNYL